MTAIKNSFEISVSLKEIELSKKVLCLLNNAGYNAFSFGDISNNLNLKPKSTELNLEKPTNYTPDIWIVDAESVLKLIKDKINSKQTILIRTNSKKQISTQDSIKQFCDSCWILNLPLVEEELLNIIAKVCIMQELVTENLLLRSLHKPNFSDSFLNVCSENMKETIHLVKKIAPLEGTILITGESGTGKTLLAKYIHSLSTHADGPFISLSCANLPRDLVESELFGHEKGAFTGATFARLGAAELSDKGTLFLDEIGDLPLELQPKLLTFLQDRLVRRVGGSTTKKVNTRIIAATNSSLDRMITEKRFREDLYYRLNVFHIRIPALRERLEDLPYLTQSILGRISKERGGKEIQIDNKMLQRLASHNWPGNVRELENLLERATAFSTGSFVDNKELIRALHKQSSDKGIYKNQKNDSQMKLADIEKQIIEKRLELNKGDKKTVAISLGISLKTLYNKIDKYKIRKYQNE